MQWNEYAALAIFVAWLFAIGASEHKQGAIVIAPMKPKHTRTLKDIMSDLLGPSAEAMNQVTGTIINMDTTEKMQLMLRRRDGTLVRVEFLAAARSPTFPAVGTGKAITAIGTTDGEGTLHAQIIVRAKDPEALWPSDQ